MDADLPTLHVARFASEVDPSLARAARRAWSFCAPSCGVSRATPSCTTPGS